MNWRRVRHLASGALIAGALLSGATVGSAVLLGSAEHRGDPVGRLSAHLESRGLDATVARGARAEPEEIPGARGSQASPTPPPAATTGSLPAPPPPPPAQPAPPPPAPAPAPVTTSTGRDDATSPARTTHVETEDHAPEPEHREDDGHPEPDD